jgi:hypothetical protein
MMKGDFMTKFLLPAVLLIILAGCAPAEEAICYTTEPVMSAVTSEAQTTAVTAAVTTKYIPTLTPAPIIAESVSEDGALKLTVKMHGTEFVTFEKITATVTLENLTDEDYSFVFGSVGPVNNEPPLYCGFWTEKGHDTLAYPMLSTPITFTPGQILKKTVEFTPNYKEMGDYIFYADMPYSKDGMNYFLSIEPIKLNVGFRYTHETSIENNTAIGRALRAEDEAENNGEPDQDYKSLPFSDDFSDKEFTYRYLGNCRDALWMVKDGSLIVYSDIPDRNGSAVIGNYSWSYYNASIDFNLHGSGDLKLRMYKQISGDFDAEEYVLVIDSEGSWYAGNSRGVADYERGEVSDFGKVVTGQFEDFDPDVWNRINMISEDGKLYISLNSGEKVYIYDLDPNSEGAILLSASNGTEFDNLEIVSAE